MVGRLADGAFVVTADRLTQGWSTMRRSLSVLMVAEREPIIDPVARGHPWNDVGQLWVFW